MKIYHMSLSIEGALRNKAFKGFTDDKGAPMHPERVEAELRKLHERGDKLMSMAAKECIGFSTQTGCPGHEE